MAFSTVIATIRPSNAAGRSASQSLRWINPLSVCVSPTLATHTQPHNNPALLHGCEANTTSPDACA